MRHGPKIAGFNQERVISDRTMTAYVYLYDQESLHCKRVVKQLRPDFVKSIERQRLWLQQIKGSFAKDFAREIELMAKLVHPNLVMILDRGETGTGSPVPYYVMEYIPGETNILEYVKEHSNDRSLMGRTLDLVGQAIEGLVWLHAKKVVHMDLKPQNILIDQDSFTVKIADLGFARSQQDGQRDNILIKGTRGFWPEWFLHSPKVKLLNRLVRRLAKPGGEPSGLVLGLCKRGDIRPGIDLYSFGQTLDSIRQQIERRGTEALSDVNRERLDFLRDLASRLKRGEFSETEEVQRFYQLTRKQTEEGPFPEARRLPVKTVRIPEMQGVPFTARVQSLVNDPLFQRLRRIKQLATVYHVYPGAVHSRFEHSLGAYARSVRYITALWENSDLFRCHVRTEEMEAAIAAALLHDIGQYPFAHIIEEILPLQKALRLTEHEELSHKILENDADIVELLGKADPAYVSADQNLTLYEALRKTWGDEVVGVLCRLLTTPAEQVETLSPVQQVLRQVISGPIDCDKLDYLSRDGVHASVSYPRGLDEGRILMSLEMIQLRDGRYALGITHKGRAAIELMIFVRYIMFTEVYWHHAARIAMRMLQFAFQEAIRTSSNRVTKELLPLLFRGGDDDFLRWLERAGRRSAGARAVLGLLAQRRLYKRLLTISRFGANARAYKEIAARRADGPRARLKIETAIVQRLNADLSRNDKLEKHDIFLDVPAPRPGDEIGGIYMVTPEEKLPVNLLARDSVLKLFGVDFITNAKKIRLLVHPEKHPVVRRVFPAETLEDIVLDAVRSVSVKPR